MKSGLFFFLTILLMLFLGACGEDTDTNDDDTDVTPIVNVPTSPPNSVSALTIDSSLAATIEAARTPVTQNADWTPLITTSGGFELVLVPAGCFMMGSDTGNPDKRPAHEQCFTSPFWITRTEVTNAQFGESGKTSGDNNPRETVTWQAAADFCQQYGMRLPTEAEWEYAARGPEGWIYPWGNEFDETKLIFGGNAILPQSVGLFSDGASWVGALDMSGNVEEWTSSLFANYPYTPEETHENPTDTTTFRVLRGGSAYSQGLALRADHRIRAEIDHADPFAGFRCVLPVNP